MAELDEKLSALLSDPGSMAQVMQLAQQLASNFGGAAEEKKAESYAEEKTKSVERETPDISKLLGTLDPGMMMKYLPLLQEMGKTNNQTMNLLYALRPFLKEDKRDKIERAARLARLIHIGKKFFTEAGGLGLV